jgi:two-component system OmpR family response regulator
MPQQKILIVEDESTLQEVLKYNLEKEGYATVTAGDGIKALEAARSSLPDFIILDLMLPKMSGFEVCRILRQEMAVPIMMLTAKEDEIDKVVGLDLGADDYMTKPFKMRELLSRIRAILRRTDSKALATATNGTNLKINDLEIDISRHKVLRKGIPLELTPKEFELLTLLAKNKGIVFGREALLEKIWQYTYSGDTRTVDVHVRWLREKIEEDPNSPKLLITVRGVGYKFEG